ncbi:MULTISPECIES: hypothetical protein [Methanosarcina]|nr:MULTISPECIES: hypothetical protein [Methanosarcina]
MEKRMYLEIAMLAYFVVLFLTIRDIRIFKRTGYISYRKGALKGLAASSLILIGAISIEAKPEIGLLIVLLGLYINRKGVREPVFTNAGTLDRFLGKTDYRRANRLRKNGQKAAPDRK